MNKRTPYVLNLRRMEFSKKKELEMLIDIGFKYCTKCKKILRTNEFYTCKSFVGKYLGDLFYWCKTCTNNEAKNIRKKNRDKILGYALKYAHKNMDILRKKSEEYRSKNRDKINEYARRYRQEHKEEIKARSALNHAIRDGKIDRKPCIKCGKDNAHGHHYDYSKPLDVMWYCRSCHQIEHRGV